MSGIVLAGGKSVRLGLNKAFLEIEGQPLVARTIQKLERLTDDLILVTNSPEAYAQLSLPVRLVRDVRPGVGALMGIYSGLRMAKFEYALAVACDMPFLNLPLLRYMILMAQGHDVVIPHADGLFEPLHAIYSVACLPAIEATLAQDRHRIIAFLERVRVRRVDAREVDIFDPQRLSFLNVNTPADWERVRQLLQQQKR